MVQQCIAPEDVLSRIEDACIALEIQEVESTIIRVVNIVYDDELYSGRSLEATLSGVIFASCRSEDVAVTPKDIAELFDVEVKCVLLSARYILRHTDILEDLPISWTTFLEELCETLSIPDALAEQAREIGSVAASNGALSGRRPRGYAAAALYAAAKYCETNKGITQRVLSEHTGVSESTIRVTYQEQLELYEEQ